MSKLAVKDEGLNKQFKLRYIKVEAEGNHEIFTIDTIMIKEIIGMNVDQIIEMEEFNLMVEFIMDEIEVDLDMNKITGMIIGEENFRGNVRMYQNFGRQNNRGGYRGNYSNENYSRKKGRGRSGERSNSGNFRRIVIVG